MTHHLELIYGAVRKGLYVFDRFKLLKVLSYLDVVKIRMLTFFLRNQPFYEESLFGSRKDNSVTCSIRYRYSIDNTIKLRTDFDGTFSLCQTVS